MLNAGTNNSDLTKRSAGETFGRHVCAERTQRLSAPITAPNGLDIVAVSLLIGPAGSCGMDGRRIDG